MPRLQRRWLCVCAYDNSVTWSACISIMNAFRLHDASCSLSRKFAISSGASGIRKSKFLKVHYIKKILQPYLLQSKVTIKHKKIHKKVLVCLSYTRLVKISWDLLSTELKCDKGECFYHAINDRK